MAEPLPELLLPNPEGWRQWLGANHETATGVWLVLARKGTTEPTTLVYDEALEEALAHGWIDGQARQRDGRTYRQRFTPRRPRSSWSRRNVGIATRLIESGRMVAAGLRQVEQAQADGRWANAYPGPREMEVPPDLESALKRNPVAAATFARLNSLNRYAILYRLHQTRRPATRAARLEKFVASLSRGETPHPQVRANREGSP